MALRTMCCGWLVMLTGCSGGFGERFARPIENYHGLKAWQNQEMLVTDIRVEFGGQTPIYGQMMMSTDTRLVRIEQRDGTILVFDGQHAWVSPASSDLKRARFHLLTWPYFLAAPFKLQDQGTIHEDLRLRWAQGEPYRACRLTFEEGTGDTPQDYYVVYRAFSGRLDAMGYIVTYGKSVAEADQAPHAITYHGFVNVDGVCLSTLWRFWHWSLETGMTGDPIGQVTLENIHFAPLDPGLFVKPSDAREDVLPTG